MSRASLLTAWPLLKGLMSRKANVFSLSKSFMEGISPAIVSESRLHQWLATSQLTLDDLAEDARGCHVGGMICCDALLSVVHGLSSIAACRCSTVAARRDPAACLPAPARCITPRLLGWLARLLLTSSLPDIDFVMGRKSRSLPGYDRTRVLSRRTRLARGRAVNIASAAY